MRHRLLVVAGAVATVLLTASSAQALPAQTPDASGGVNGPVRALAQAQGSGENVIWIGGRFTQILSASGTSAAAASGLAPFDDTTGALDTSVHIPMVTGGTATVYGMSLSGGILYFDGNFTAVDGTARKNVAAINPLTGALLPFAPKGVAAATSILATSSAIYVGTGKLLSFQLNGAKTALYSPPVAHTDPTIRAHTTIAQFRDIVEVGSTLVAACQCDSMDDSNSLGHAVKAVVEIDATTGDLLSWAPANLPASSAAFGISLIADSSTIDLAAGGNDFTAAYDFSSPGKQQWKTDTSGSSQAIAMFEGELVIGGHFDWTASPSAGACGDNSSPNTKCYHTPKLVAMDPSTGKVVLSAGVPWNPGICCKYNGLWVVLPDANGSQLHVGGEFTKAGGTWSGSGTSWMLKMSKAHSNYARFSDAPVPA